MCINSLSLFVLFTYNKSQSSYIGHFNDSAGNVFSWRVFFFFFSVIVTYLKTHSRFDSKTVKAVCFSAKVRVRKVFLKAFL